MSNMTPTIWKAGVDSLRDRLRRVWPLSSLEEGQRPLETEWAPFWSRFDGPAVDIEDCPDAVVVTAELPGLDRGDFEVEVESERLILRGEKKAAREKQEGAYWYRESSYGSFRRVIDLPASVDKDAAAAEYKQGVLTIKLPKTERSKGRRIVVRTT